MCPLVPSTSGMNIQRRKNLTTFITRETNVVSYMYDYAPFSPHFGGEHYFSESIVRFYTLYLMANTFFGFEKHHMSFGLSRSAYREEGGRNWKRNVTNKTLNYSSKIRTWKNLTRTPQKNQTKNLSNCYYIQSKMLKTQLCLFPWPF